MDFVAISQADDLLGECPIWCERSGTLWWVDVLRPALRSFQPDTGIIREHPVGGRRLGSIALTTAGGLLLARDDGIFKYDPLTGEETFLCDPEPGRPDHRKNDGRVDPRGRFWVGTLNETDYRADGSLYRIDGDGTTHQAVTGLQIPNSLAFSPDGDIMYYADTRAYVIWRCRLHRDSGTIAEQAVFARTSSPARPDGSCIDEEGFLWNAEYAGGRLKRYAPDGRVDRIIEVPTGYPTCCCFGGRDLDTLFVTTASFPLSAHERLTQPLGGALLAARPGMRGRVENRFQSERELVGQTDGDLMTVTL